MLFLLVSSALANSPVSVAWYDMDQVAAGSQVFRDFAEQSAPAFDALQTELKRNGLAIDDLDKGILALGDRVPKEQQERSTRLRKERAHSYLVAQAYVDILQEDSATTFGTALERAIERLSASYALKECSRPSGMAAMGPGRSGPGCEGEDVSGRLSATLDADPVLAAEVKEILEIEWPAISSAPAPQKAIPLGDGDGDQTLYMPAVLDQLVPGRFEALGAALQSDLAPLQAQLRSEGPEREAALAAAQAHRESYEQSVADLGSLVLGAIQPALQKRSISAGLCANPAALGGCVGKDLTGELLPELVEDRKVQKRLK